jgi:hypothetical protein
MLLRTAAPSWLRAPEGHLGGRLAVPSRPFKQPRRSDPMLHTSTLLGAARHNGRFVFAALFLAVVLAGCGHDPLPTSPSTGQPTTGSLDVSFTVYDSAKGPIRSFKKRVPTVGISAKVTLDTSELGGGIDPHRFVVRAAHQGDRLGAFVAATRSGTLEFPTTASFSDLDVFVMNASNGTDYSCADVGDTNWDPKALGGARYGTIRLAGSGESFLYGQSHSYLIQDGSDDDLIQAVKDVNSVLNPFGLAFARMDYVGRVATASISAGWSADIPPNQGVAGPGLGVPWIAVGPDIVRPESHEAYVLWIHELLHAWQNAPDYYHSGRCSTNGLSCLLWDCAGGPPRSVVPLSPQGRDIVRYWTLMSM